MVKKRLLSCMLNKLLIETGFPKSKDKICCHSVVHTRQINAKALVLSYQRADEFSSLFWSGDETGKHIPSMLAGKLAWLLFFYAVYMTNAKCCFVNAEQREQVDCFSVNKRSRIAFSIARAPLGHVRAVLSPTRGRLVFKRQHR